MVLTNLCPRKGGRGEGKTGRNQLVVWGIIKNSGSLVFLGSIEKWGKEGKLNPPSGQQKTQKGLKNSEEARVLVL